MRSTYTPAAVSAMLSNSQFMENYQEAKGDIVKDEVIDNFYASYAVETELELKSTKSELETTKAKKEEAEILAGKTKEELEESQRKAAQEKIEKEEYKRAFEQKSVEADTTTKDLILRANSSANEAIGLKKTINIITGLLIIAGWMIYFIIRQPLSSATIPVVEIMVSLIVGGYLYLLIYLGVWRSKAILAFGTIVPTLFVLSFFIPEKYQISLQLLDGIIALSVYVIDHFNKK